MSPPQRTHRLPREMTPKEPATFAAELIHKLQKLKVELESRHSLEERLQQMREVSRGTLGATGWGGESWHAAEGADLARHWVGSIPCSPRESLESC